MTWASPGEGALELGFGNTLLSSLFPQPLAMDYDLFAGHKKLAAWRDRVESFLGAELCREAHGPILHLLQQATNNTLPRPPPEFCQNAVLRISRIP